MQIQPIPRTVEEAVRVGPFPALDWLMLLSAFLVPKMLFSSVQALTVANLISWDALAQSVCLGGAVLVLRLKAGRPKNYFWYWLAYALRPNRY